MARTAPVALRRRPDAFVAAAILLLAACTDSGAGRSAGTPTPANSVTAPSAPADSSAPAQHSPSVTGTAPSDPAQAEDRVRKNWEAFFASTTPLDAKVALVENGEQYALMVQGFADDKRASQFRAQVHDVAFASSAEAEVTYDLSRQGRAVKTGARGMAVSQDGTWKVSVETLCALSQLGTDVPRAAACR
ncbi:hypothetical protein [Actinacidiphila soli]|uniref:hypothetical protein n=1 Tax=Actinacidiphila soli TaxID=2487275 RepID=UPI000FCBD93F|nr:hypothetical protein [Actinacidiphila soli]